MSVFRMLIKFAAESAGVHRGGGVRPSAHANNSDYEEQRRKTTIEQAFQENLDQDVPDGQGSELAAGTNP